MLLQLTDFSTEPLYRQIARQLGDSIRRGELLGGKPLDSIRQIARGQHLSIFTVERAYQELLQEGLIESGQENKYHVAFNKKTIETKSGNTAGQADPDVTLAARIQASLFPRTAIHDDNVTIVAASLAREFVGGDMYDYFQIDKNRYGVVIADACGHGLAAALIISQIQAIFKSEVKNGTSPKNTMSFINEHVRRSFIRSQFITLFYGIFDAHTHVLTYINAGHNFPFVVRKNGDYEFLTNSSPALGLFDTIDFHLGAINVLAGDVVTFYTDGITEAMNNNHEEFGEERLLEIIRTHKTEKPKELIDAIFRTISSYISNNVCRDDRTLVILQAKEQTHNPARFA